MVITVDIYKEIRKRRLAGESQRGIARALGISRNTVKKFWEGERVHGERIERPREPSVLTPEVRAAQISNATRPGGSMTGWWRSHGLGGWSEAGAESVLYPAVPQRSAVCDGVPAAEQRELPGRANPGI